VDMAGKLNPGLILMDLHMTDRSRGKKIQRPVSRSRAPFKRSVPLQLSCYRHMRIHLSSRKRLMRVWGIPDQTSSGCGVGKSHHYLPGTF
jgi:hypothetical protein